MLPIKTPRHPLFTPPMLISFLPRLCVLSPTASPFLSSTALPHLSLQHASSSRHRSVTHGSHELPQHSPSPGGGGGSSCSRAAARTSCFQRVVLSRFAFLMRGTDSGAYMGVGFNSVCALWGVRVARRVVRVIVSVYVVSYESQFLI